MNAIRKLPSDFRWCVSTLGCAELNIDETAALAGEFGICELELRGLENELDLPAYFIRTFGSPDRLAKKLADGGIRIAVLDTSLKLIGNTEKDREDFLRLVPWAEALQTPFLRVFDGGTSDPAQAPRHFREAAKTVGWWQSLRKENGWQVDIAMETHDAICSADACDAFEASLERPCPILWDAHHTFHKSGEAITKTWERIRPFVRHIHFKDSIAEKNEINDYTLAVPGEGRFPLVELFAMLRRDGYRGAVCLEWERKWQPWAEPLPKALEGLAQTLT